MFFGVERGVWAFVWTKNRQQWSWQRLCGSESGCFLHYFRGTYPSSWISPKFEERVEAFFAGCSWDPWGTFDAWVCALSQVWLCCAALRLGLPEKEIRKFRLRPPCGLPRLGASGGCKCHQHPMFIPVEHIVVKVSTYCAPMIWCGPPKIELIYWFRKTTHCQNTPIPLPKHVHCTAKTPPLPDQTHFIALSLHYQSTQCYGGVYDIRVLTEAAVAWSTLSKFGRVLFYQQPTYRPLALFEK